jgi:hypothetical protein
LTRTLTRTFTLHRTLTRALLACAVVLAAGAADRAAAQSGTVHGELIDATTRQPVAGAELRIRGLDLLAVTDDRGAFQFHNVPAGARTIEVRHVAYGVHETLAEVLPAGVTAVRILVSDAAIVLSPIQVRGLSADERADRGAGYRRNVVTREELAALRGTGLRFADVVRQAVPGVRVRTLAGVVGAATCIELRSATLGHNRCLAPAVFVDGVPVMDVAMLYATLALETIESIEVVPAAEAGGRFGTGALHGALLIESRRPGAASAARLPVLRTPFHDWGAEDRRHATLRAYGAAAAGSGLGLLAGLAIAESCIATRAPAHDRLISHCDPATTLAAAAAAIAAPALGSAAGARIGGLTRQSHGRFLPAAAAGAMAVVPGYTMILTGRRLDSDALRAIGKLTLVALTPLMSTLADHQFRQFRTPREERTPE